MMQNVIFEWQNYKLFSYEREFAIFEIEKIFGVSPEKNGNNLTIPLKAFTSEEAERLTYFSKVIHPDGEVYIPLQAKLEASAQNGGREKQATRYSAHGLHEYKGKFNPQIVRSIGNFIGVREGASILDPFCGSGTTLLEGAHIGWNVFGVDVNPHAIRIANAKIRALSLANSPLENLAKGVVSALDKKAYLLSGTKEISRGALDKEMGKGWLNKVPAKDYLTSWFSIPVLSQIIAINETLLSHVPNDNDRIVFLVILSDLLRGVSLQEPADLRIRRRKNTQPNYPLIESYIKTLIERVNKVCLARKELGKLKGTQKAIHGDIRKIHLRSIPKVFSGGFDAVITSPPYETALPYIDTQRLSLVLLGDIGSKEIHKTEKELIGAREITKRERLAIEQIIKKGDNNLPRKVIQLCRELLDAASLPGNGFRRVNRPALTYRYFKKMSEFFKNIIPMLRSNAKVALVVGTNRTTLGGKTFIIDTPRLLKNIAEHCGYVLIEEHQMNTYQRYDLHQRNSINEEMLIVLAVD